MLTTGRGKRSTHNALESVCLVGHVKARVCVCEGGGGVGKRRHQPFRTDHMHSLTSLAIDTFLHWNAAFAGWDEHPL